MIMSIYNIDIQKRVLEHSLRGASRLKAVRLLGYRINPQTFATRAGYFLFENVTTM